MSLLLYKSKQILLLLKIPVGNSIYKTSFVKESKRTEVSQTAFKIMWIERSTPETKPNIYSRFWASRTAPIHSKLLFWLIFLGLFKDLKKETKIFQKQNSMLWLHWHENKYKQGYMYLFFLFFKNERNENISVHPKLFSKRSLYVNYDYGLSQLWYRFYMHSPLKKVWVQSSVLVHSH